MILSASLSANLLHRLLESPPVYRLGWALLHSLWQGAAVALLLGLLLGALRKRGPQARYLAACGAMLVLVALPAVTFLLVNPPPALPAVAAAPAAIPSAFGRAVDPIPEPQPDPSPAPAAAPTGP